MTPKEKAKELMQKYDFVYIQSYTSMFEVKQCATIAVDEILENLDFELCDLNGDFFINPKIKYFQDVKKEIKKL